MDGFWNVKQAPVKEAPMLGLTGMGGGAASFMWAGAASGSGSLYAWGANYYGFSGFNNVYPSGRKSSPTQVGTDTTWKYPFSYRSAHAVKWDGTAWAWGRADNGLLGLNAPETDHKSSPTQIGTDTTWNFLGNWQYGGWGLKTDGTIWSWGYGPSGALGQNQGNLSVSSPMQIGTDTNWTSFRQGHEGTSFATKTDGTLWVWGKGPSGRLGLNNNAAKSSPTQLPGTWAQGFNSIAAGNTGCLGIKADGSLWSWGYGSSGCLGMNEPGQSWSSPRQVGTDTNWRSVHMQLSGPGSRSTHATKTDGTLWGMGSNTYGNLGLNTSKISNSNRRNVSSPTQVGTDTTWMSTSYGMQEKGGTFWTKTDGSLWFLGGLQENQGIAGANVSGPWMRSSPVLIGQGSFYRAAAGPYGGFAISGKNVED